jgi:hypothetical protein
MIADFFRISEMEDACVSVQNKNSPFSIDLAEKTLHIANNVFSVESLPATIPQRSILQRGIQDILYQ